MTALLLVTGWLALNAAFVALLRTGVRGEALATTAETDRAAGRVNAHTARNHDAR